MFREQWLRNVYAVADDTSYAVVANAICYESRYALLNLIQRFFVMARKGDSVLKSWVSNRLRILSIMSEIVSYGVFVSYFHLQIVWKPYFKAILQNKGNSNPSNVISNRLWSSILINQGLRFSGKLHCNFWYRKEWNGFHQFFLILLSKMNEWRSLIGFQLQYC